jgi:hypothetical protein
VLRKTATFVLVGLVAIELYNWAPSATHKIPLADPLFVAAAGPTIATFVDTIIAVAGWVITRIVDRQTKHHSSLVSLQNELNENLNIAGTTRYSAERFAAVLRSGNLYGIASGR